MLINSDQLVFWGKHGDWSVLWMPGERCERLQPYSQANWPAQHSGALDASCCHWQRPIGMYIPRLLCAFSEIIKMVVKHFIFCSLTQLASWNFCMKIRLRLLGTSTCSGCILSVKALCLHGCISAVQLFNRVPEGTMPELTLSPRQMLVCRLCTSLFFFYYTIGSTFTEVHLFVLLRSCY